MQLFSVKMRASRKVRGEEEHISGAERIVGAQGVPALTHDLFLFVSKAESTSSRVAFSERYL